VGPGREGEGEADRRGGKARGEKRWGSPARNRTTEVLLSDPAEAEKRQRGEIQGGAYFGETAALETRSPRGEKLLLREIERKVTLFKKTRGVVVWGGCEREK